MEQFDIAETRDGNKVTLAVTGQLNTLTAPKFQDALLSCFDVAGATVELDFKGLSYVSSAGLRALLLGEKKAKTTGGMMKIVNVSEDVKTIFGMTGFSDILKIV